ncbi:MAG: lactate utilization protein [Ruminococcaceae bacterium]|jgi:L-lactate utilization protein LutB|nr:lactate utilization protein [Oscillospiraceae bacterium]
MDASLNAVIEKKINRTIGNLQNNKMDAYYVKTCKDAVNLIDQLCAEGESVAVGGSMTLFECGIIDYLRSGKYQFFDRYAPGVDVGKVFRQAFFCDTFFTSSNAITEQGELYNVDGNGNRVAAMIFGPKSVIVVAGYNKIVADLEAARRRVSDIAAPANAMRLDKKTPCKVLGACQNCRSDDRICADYVIHGQQTAKGRIKVIIVGEQLGY